MPELELLYNAILNGESKDAAAITREALAASADPMHLVTAGMTPAMNEVGRRFEEGEYFVPELLLSARAMKSALEILRPLLAASGAQPIGKVIIGTVKGDLHDIGKNLVASMLEGGGFEIHDLGSDVPPERFVEAVMRTNADIVALSALLTVTMPAMQATIEALSKAGIRDRVRVMLGGAPLTQKYADIIGADGYSENANAALALAKRLIRAEAA
jgi:corrinoid protein of di/trimethylamine methyltransferase